MTKQPDVNHDILLEILDWVWHPAQRRAQLLNISLVCREWHAVAQMLIDKTIELTLCEKYEQRNLHILQRLQTDRALKWRIRRLIIRDLHIDHNVSTRYNKAPPDYAHDFYFKQNYRMPGEPFIKLSSQLMALQQVLYTVKLPSFCWQASCSLPSSIAQALKRGVNAKNELQIELDSDFAQTKAYSWHVAVNYQYIDTLMPLASILTRLELCVPDLTFLTTGTVKNLTMSDLSALIWSATALRRLKVYIVGRHIPYEHLTDGGMPIYHYVEIRPLDGLDLLRRPLTLSNKKLAIDDLSLCNICCCNRAGPLLDDILQLAGIEKLEITCLSILHHIKDKLPRLTHLTLHITPLDPIHAEAFAYCHSLWTEQDVRTALAPLTDLTTLELHGLSGKLSELYLHQAGKSLRELLVPMIWSTNADYTTNEDRLSYIESISIACPHLTALAVNLPTNRVSFHKLLHTVAKSFRQLSQLHVYRFSHDLTHTFSLPDTSQSLREVSASMPWLEKICLITFSCDGEKSAGVPKRKNCMMRKTRTLKAKDRPLQNYEFVDYDKDYVQAAMLEGRPGPSDKYWYERLIAAGRSSAVLW